MMYLISAACLLSISIVTECSSENTAESVLPNSTASLPPYLQGKDESLLTCVSYALKLNEVKFLPDGLIHVPDLNLTLNESFYIRKDDNIFLCKPHYTYKTQEEKSMGLTSYLTVIGLSMSMIGLILHLIVFVLVPDLRNLPGWNLATLCASLFISYLLLLLNGTEAISNNKDSCVAIASAMHFFLLSSFMWMSIISCHVFTTLRQVTGGSTLSSSQFSFRRFGLYCLIAFGIALLFTLSGVLADVLDFVPVSYRPEFHKSCWFSQMIPFLVLFIIPVIFLCCMNFLLFLISMCIIYSFQKNSDAQKPVLKRTYLMYFRLSIIMGVTWLVGIVANAINAEWMWCIFVLLNAFQGFFIFLAFTCRKKVMKYFRQKLRPESSSQESLTPTFQMIRF